MKRNPNVELWRCFCMFAIVLGHVIYNNHVASVHVFCWHVTGFLIITGYFGTSFKFKKALRLINTAYLCYFITVPLRSDMPTAIELILPHGGWFLPFYLVLMIVSPILNAALADTKMHKALLCSIVALLIIEWVPLFIPGNHAAMLLIPGFQGKGLFLMIATYILGRIAYRRIDFSGERRKLAVFLGGGAFLAFNVLCIFLYSTFPRTRSYVSPVAMIIAFSGFIAFLNLRMPVWLNRAVCFISPSMFGVFLLHECCLREWQYSSFAKESIVHAIVYSFGLFGACVMIDMVRRFVVYLAMKSYKGIFWK